MNALDSSSIAASSAKVASALSAKPKAADGSDSSDTSTGDASTITANDFLTLLVSELKNQDPTQPTDPGAYLQQLVSVNSLEQLIQINQGLTAVESGGS